MQNGGNYEVLEMDDEFGQVVEKERITLVKLFIVHEEETNLTQK